MNGNLGGNPKDKLERNGAGGSLTEILMVSQNFSNARESKDCYKNMQSSTSLVEFS